jgi:hypothetical protein
VQPLALALLLLLELILVPAWVPYVLWIPVLGPLVAGKRASAYNNQETSALTGRLENLTLIQAAGAASALPPESAFVAYGATAVIGAAISSAGRAMMHATERNRRHAQVAGAGTAQAADLTDAERHELIVHRYLLARLREAEEGQRKRDAAEKAKAAATTAYARKHDASRVAGITRRAAAAAAAQADTAPPRKPQAVIEALSRLDEDGAAQNGRPRSMKAAASSRFESAALAGPRTAQGRGARPA